MHYNIDDLISNFQDFKDNNNDTKNYHILSHISEEEENVKHDYKYVEMDSNSEERENAEQIFFAESDRTGMNEHNITKLIMPHVNNIAIGYGTIDEKILEQLTDRIIFSCIDHIDGMEDIYLELDRSPYSRYHLLRELINVLVYSVNR